MGAAMCPGFARARAFRRARRSCRQSELTGALTLYDAVIAVFRNGEIPQRRLCAVRRLCAAARDGGESLRSDPARRAVAGPPAPLPSWSHLLSHDPIAPNSAEISIVAKLQNVSQTA
jgi:hypothetical protein